MFRTGISRGQDRTWPARASAGAGLGSVEIAGSVVLPWLGGLKRNSRSRGQTVRRSAHFVILSACLGYLEMTHAAHFDTLARALSVTDIPKRKTDLNMTPQRIDGLIVPVAASTNHVAFSSIRMEPTWRALGLAARFATHLAVKNGPPPRNVPIPEMQSILVQEGQVLKHSRR